MQRHGKTTEQACRNYCKTLAFELALWRGDPHCHESLTFLAMLESILIKGAAQVRIQRNQTLTPPDGSFPPLRQGHFHALRRSG